MRSWHESRSTCHNGRNAPNCYFYIVLTTLWGETVKQIKVRANVFGVHRCVHHCVLLPIHQKWERHSSWCAWTSCIQTMWSRLKYLLSGPDHAPEGLWCWWGKWRTKRRRLNEKAKGTLSISNAHGEHGDYIEPADGRNRARAYQESWDEIEMILL